MRQLKLVSQPNKPIGGPSPSKVEISKLASSSLSGGMVSNKIPNNLQENEFVLARNVRVYDDRTQRRVGLSNFTPAKPDSNPVLTFVSFSKQDKSVKLLRFTPSTIYSAGAVSWTEITGDGLTGLIDDRFTVVIADDRCFFTNNGVQVIQEIDTSTNTYVDLGNAPAARFITGFADRLIAANITGNSPSPIGLAWSGNLNYDEWDPIVDATAGFTPLVDSPSDTSDFIQGLVQFSNVVVIPRERSIWDVTKKGVATDPFIFTSRVPSIGCDCPWSVTKIPGGIAWVDVRTRDVYIYTLDGAIQPISDPIRPSLINAITDPLQVIGSYNQGKKELGFAILGDGVVKVWTYSFLAKAWWFDEYSQLTSINDLDFATSTGAIQDLEGSIEDLLGPISGLGPVKTKVTRFLGFSDGELSYEDNTVDSGYMMEIISKDYEIPTLTSFIAEMQLEYLPSKTGQITIEFQQDALPWKPFRTINITSDQLNIPQYYVQKKAIRGRKFRFKIRASSGLFDLNFYSLWVGQSGDARK